MRIGLATLTVTHWDGDPPLPGQYIKSERGRTAFLIVEVRRSREGARSFGRFVCERQRADSLHPDAIVHPWVWSKR